MSTFADRLAGAMKSANVDNAAEVARNAGCTRQAIHRWLKGYPFQDGLILYGIARHLGVSAAWLLLDEGLPSQRESLTDDEKLLLEHYRAMTEQKQFLLMQIVSGMRD